MECANCKVVAPRFFDKFDVSKDVKLPTRATSRSAGYDFYMPETVTLPPHKVVLIKSGITAYMNDDEYLQMQVRSSLALKYGLSFVNGVGIIDADYAGREIGFIFMNLGKEPLTLEKDTRVVQGIFKKYYITDDDSPLSGERSGGFGSTGER